MEKEPTLAEGEAIFRISFWKDDTALYSASSPMLWSQLQVLQRVRADHSFFRSFIKEDDDCLPKTAWLFWCVTNRASDRKWSEQGISKKDIEVLDFDGEWKPFDQSEIMSPPDIRFGKLGFQPYHYLSNGTFPLTVYAASRLVEIDGEASLVFLLNHPVETHQRIYNDANAMQHVLDELLKRVGDFPIKNLRFFIFDDGEKTFDHVHLAEVPMKGEWRLQRVAAKLFGFIPITLTNGYKYTIRLDDRKIIWHQGSGDLVGKILRAFHLEPQKQRIARYVNTVVAARDIAQSKKIISEEATAE
ncbi:hypothetical protein [Collimonas fungivorans]|nr:hypothetical protein [Collimonas fungivorans]